MSIRSDLYRNVDEQDDLCNADNYEEVIGKNRFQYVWFNIYWYVVLHSLALYGLVLIFSISLPTFIFFMFMYAISGLGITAGAHRLWSHRSYQAKLPLQILLMIFNTVAAQNSALEWCRDHRVHHKYSETHADPHNAKRGFFFAHMGWLMVRKHPDVRSKGKVVSMTDLENNPVLKFQAKYYLPLVFLLGAVFPAFVPWACWGEPLLVGFLVPGVLRYVAVLHATWLVNSLAHIFGNKPYDRKINPAESAPVCIFALGEGFHNYHHTFPYDYSTSEFGVTLNPTTLFINIMARIGWAYDLKKVSAQAISGRKLRTGDGTPHIFFPFPTRAVEENENITIPKQANKNGSVLVEKEMANGNSPVTRGESKTSKTLDTEGIVGSGNEHVTQNGTTRFESLNSDRTNDPLLKSLENEKEGGAALMEQEPLIGARDVLSKSSLEFIEEMSERSAKSILFPPNPSSTTTTTLPKHAISNGVGHKRSSSSTVFPSHFSLADGKGSIGDETCKEGKGQISNTFLTKRDIIEQTETLRQRIFSHTNLLNLSDC